MIILYLVFMLGIGIWFFVRSKNAGEKDYFLGGREMGAWVSGLSAGASDMSAWVLMGMPASIYAYGMGKAWIPVGLFIGYSLSWIFIAPRLRSFSIVCGDSITIPQYLTNRFKASSRALQIISAVIFLVAYTVYSASSIKACGTLFETVLGIPAQIAMYAAAVIIVGYTFLGEPKAQIVGQNVQPAAARRCAVHHDGDDFQHRDARNERKSQKEPALLLFVQRFAQLCKKAHKAKHKKINGR